MIDFQPVSLEQMDVLKKIMNSNQEFNCLSEGHAELTDEEIINMYESSKHQGAVMNFIIDDGHPVGVIDYLMENPSDKMPWLGLLIIDHDFQGRGYAIGAFNKYESLMKEKGIKKVRLGVIKENDRALNFWVKRGFSFYEEKEGDKWTVLCFEKVL
ncbi:GNAT family N-acetyltransferase [Robertmurraya massiliosenegalensis]|uniref:GNAT family N-acetyltransferase n=1 Tax=Robertmurraya massiliosenegalensis TaxID=1287657 RepID=UPI0002EA4FFE|nr:GNAT family N-acetyltransferase [Robertmurraya massiliosenegalensis]